MALRAVRSGEVGAHVSQPAAVSPAPEVSGSEDLDTEAGPESADPRRAEKRAALCALRVRQARALVLACGTHEKSERWMATRAGVSRTLWRGYTSGARPIDPAAVALASAQVFRTWTALLIADLSASGVEGPTAERSLPRLVQNIGKLGRVLEDESIDASECEETARAALELKSIADRLLSVAEAGGTKASKG
jgi:hypothetical protein